MRLQGRTRLDWTFAATSPPPEGEVGPEVRERVYGLSGEAARRSGFAVDLSHRER
jgi:hypothetical protein